jgi:hypothetical protein
LVVGVVLEIVIPCSCVAFPLPLQADVVTAPVALTLKQPEAPARLVIARFVVVELPATKRLPVPWLVVVPMAKPPVVTRDVETAWRVEVPKLLEPIQSGR